jgi:hypothetical protein
MGNGGLQAGLELRRAAASSAVGRGRRPGRRRAAGGPHRAAALTEPRRRSPQVADLVVHRQPREPHRPPSPPRPAKPSAAAHRRSRILSSTGSRVNRTNTSLWMALYCSYRECTRSVAARSNSASTGLCVCGGGGRGRAARAGGGGGCSGGRCRRHVQRRHGRPAAAVMAAQGRRRCKRPRRAHLGASATNTARIWQPSQAMRSP